MITAARKSVTTHLNQGKMKQLTTTSEPSRRSRFCSRQEDLRQRQDSLQEQVRCTPHLIQEEARRGHVPPAPGFSLTGGSAGTREKELNNRAKDPCHHEFEDSPRKELRCRPRSIISVPNNVCVLNHISFLSSITCTWTRKRSDYKTFFTFLGGGFIKSKHHVKERFDTCLKKLSMN
jgi:hypothetical protein